MRTGKKSRIAAVIVCGCILGGLMGHQMASGAIFDESKAVTYGEYSASHAIEESTLFIGTYLIHSQSLTDELYEKAEDSATDSNQMRVYYKSELAGGAWFDITDATGLSDIAGQGTTVEEAELADLWVTCCTGSDGITRDARDGSAVSIFDDPDPYDLYHLPELEPIKLQYDNTFSSDSYGVDRYYYNNIKAFFELDLRNDVTNTCDGQLAGLQSCYESLQASGRKELAELVSGLMEKIDAARRAEIFSILAETEQNELKKLQDIFSGSNYREKDYNDKQFVENFNVSDALGTSLENCQESYIEYSGKKLEQGGTVLKNAEYEKSMGVVGLALGGWSGEMETLLLQLQHLYHIQDNVLADVDGELNLLDGELLGKAEEKYRQGLSSGAGGAYQAAVANGVSLTARNQVLEEQKAELNGARSELQYLIQAKTSRQEPEAAVAYIYQRIEDARGLYNVVAKDDFQVKAGETVDAYILWLQELARSISSENEELGSEMQELEARKEELLTSQAEALDQNDLSTAKKYEAMAALVDEQIAAKEQELNAILASSSSSAAQKAQAANQAGDSTALNNINQMKNSALADIADGNTDGSSFGSTLDALASLGAESALAEIRDKLEASGNKELLKKADKAIEDSKESSLHDIYGSGDGGAGAGGEGAGAGSGAAGAGTGTAGAGTGTAGAGGAGTGSGTAGAGSGAAGAGTGTAGAGGAGTGSGAAGAGSEGAGTGSGTAGAGTGTAGGGTGSGTAGEGTEGAGTGSGAAGDGSGTDGAGASSLSEDDLLALVEGIFGNSFDNLSDSEKAAATAALNRIGQSGSRHGADLARVFLNQCVGEGNPYVFRKLKGVSTEHIPLKLIGVCGGYRYLYSDSEKEVTLTRRSSVYRFTVYSDQVTLWDGTTEKMTASVKVQNLPYLAEEDAMKYFSCGAEYIDTTDYGIVLNVKMQELADEMVSASQEGAR